MTQNIYDVIICGGGPVGLLLSYQLARLGLSILTIERYDKTQQAMYGRASTLFPGTIEMLDRLELLDEMAQIGLIGKGSVTYKDGQRIHDRGWDFIGQITDTYFNYCLNIRQKYSEAIFRSALERHGGRVNAGWTLEDFAVEDAIDDLKISATMTDESGTAVTARSKYIIGADGGTSSVRQIAGIPFIGEKSSYHWIRIDALIKTDMPDARLGFGAIESKTHGNVLWVALDHGRSRIGFALPQALYEEYGNSIPENIVKQEAVKAMAPFKIEFVSVDWWTIYSVGQRLADTFQHKDRVLLAGDAAHTHSSGAAQGMNTGVHDAVNLAWKLAGVLKGWYKPEVLQTYSLERRGVAQHLIDLDKTISTLISGHIPESQKGLSDDADVNQVLYDVTESSKQFTIGLGVTYKPDVFLNRACEVGSIQPGHRAPDVLVRKPGNQCPTRLYELIRNNGKFWVIVFAGEPHDTAKDLQKLRNYLDSKGSFVHRLENAFNFLTVIAGSGSQPDEVLGIEKFGRACYDIDHSAFTRYGISTAEGGIAVLRPDGVLATTTRLDQGCELGNYFEALIPSKP